MNRLLMLRRAMMSAGAAIKKFVVSSASGIVSFVTNLVMPTKITCEFSPVQSGTGDPSPSNVRPISGWTGCEIYRTSNNNLLMPKDEQNYYPTFIKNGTTVCASAKTSVNDTVRYYRKNKTQVTYLFLQGASDAEGYKFRSYTATEDIYYIKFDGNNPDYQVNLGSTRLPYGEPQTTALPVNWKSNLIDFYSAYSGKSGITMTGSDANGYTISGLASAVRNAAIISVPAELSGKTLQLSVTLSPMENGNLSCAITNTATGTVRTPNVTKGNTERVTVTFEATATTKIQMDYGAGDKQCSVSNIMLCEAGQVDYLPYGMGGVYGGTLTINEDGTGTLVKTYHYIDVNPSSASLNADKDTHVWAQISLKSGYYATANSDQSVSNIFKGGSYVGTTWKARTSATGNRIIVSMPIDYNTTEKIREFFTNNPTQFAYPLATPVTYNLTASQVNSIIGANNIWHDMNGAITVEYYKKQ